MDIDLYETNNSAWERGQGAVTSSQVLAIAAFLDGKHSQAFPNFGVERTGAPVRSYARIDDKKNNS